MVKFKLNENLLKNAVFILLAVMCGLQIFARRGLFADGSYFLVDILSKQNFSIQEEKTRLFAYILNQFPTVLAVKLGITNLPFLTYLFAGWLVFIPLFCWSLALFKLRDTGLFWPFLALFSLVYFGCNAFSIGEFNISFALSACCMAFLWVWPKLTKADLAILVLMAFALVMSYSSTLFMGALLLLLTFKNMKEANNKRMKLYFYALSWFFCLSIAVGIWSYIFPGNPENKEHALNFLPLLYNQQLWAEILCTLLLIVQAFFLSKIKRDFVFLLILAVEIVILTGILRPLAPMLMEYAVRVFIAIILFLGCALISYFVWRGSKSIIVRERFVTLSPFHYALPIFILFAELALFDMSTSFGFNRYLNQLAEIIKGHEGFVDHPIVSWHCDDDYTYGWSWTYPTLSLVLRHSPREAIILNPANGVDFEKFDPRTQLPDLTRYY